MVTTVRTQHSTWAPWWQTTLLTTHWGLSLSVRGPQCFLVLLLYVRHIMPEKNTVCSVAVMDYFAMTQQGSKETLDFLCILCETRNMPGKLKRIIVILEGLFHYGFLKYRNEIHKEAWFRKTNCFISAIMFIFIVWSVQQSLLNEG